MKRIFTLLFAVLTATTIMAQMHGPMKFVGASNMSVSTMSIDNPSDTILFAMNGMESGDITLPEMKGMQTCGGDERRARPLRSAHRGLLDV